jgi:hypothetical protein
MRDQLVSVTKQFVEARWYAFEADSLGDTIAVLKNVASAVTSILLDKPPLPKGAMYAANLFYNNIDYRLEPADGDRLLAHRATLVEIRAATERALAALDPPRHLFDWSELWTRWVRDLDQIARSVNGGHGEIERLIAVVRLFMVPLKKIRSGTRKGARHNAGRPSYSYFARSKAHEINKWPRFVC